MGWGSGGGGGRGCGCGNIDDDIDDAGRAMKSMVEMWGTMMAERSK
jgi:hypothetical protein